MRCGSGSRRPRPSASRALDREVDEAFPGIGAVRPDRARCSSARARSPAGSSGSPRWTGSRARRSCARDACRDRCTPARCEVLRLRGTGALPNAPGLRLVEVGTATLARGSSSATSSARPTPPPRDATRGPCARESGRYHRPAPAPLVVAEGRTALERVARARAHLPHVRVGVAGRARQPAALGGRRACAQRSARASSSPTLVRRSRSTPPRRSCAPRSARPTSPGRASCSSAARPPRSCSRSPARRAEHAARPRRGPTAAHLVRRPPRGSSGCSAASRAPRVAVGGVARRLARRDRGRGAVAAVVAGAPVAACCARASCRATGSRSRPPPRCSPPRWSGSRCRCASRGRAARRAGRSSRSRAARDRAVALAGGVADEERLARGEDRRCCSSSCPASSRSWPRSSSRGSFPALARLVADRGRRSALSARLAARRARARPRRGRRDGRLPHDRLRARAPRRGLPGDARARRTRAGCVPGSARRQRARGPRAPRPRLRRRAARAVPSARGQGRSRLPGAARHGRAPAGPSASAASRCSGSIRGAIESVGVWRPGWAGGRTAAQLQPSSTRAAGRAARGPAPRTAGRAPGRAGPDRARRDRARSDGRFVASISGGRRRAGVDDSRPALPRGSRLVALELVPPPRIIERGADAGIAFVGTLRLSGPLARELRGWIGRGRPQRADRRPAASTCVSPLTLARTPFLRPRQPTDESPPPVLATPRLAELAGGVGGQLPLQIGGGSVPVQVAGVVDRFPGRDRGDAWWAIGSRCGRRSTPKPRAPRARTRSGCGCRRIGSARSRRRSSARPSELSRRRYAPRSRRRRGTIRSRTGRCSRSSPPPSSRSCWPRSGSRSPCVPTCATTEASTTTSRRRARHRRFLRRVVRVRAATLSAVGLVAGLATGSSLCSRSSLASSPSPPAAGPRSRRSPPSSIRRSSLPASPASPRWLRCSSPAATQARVRGLTRADVQGDRVTSPLVDARELFAVYPSATGGVAALQGLTLAVDEDEICVVLGPSGSGKTTLMRVLAGLARPSAGSLVVADVDLAARLVARARPLPPRRARLRRSALLASPRRRAHGRGARRSPARARLGTARGASSPRERASRTRRTARPCDRAPARAVGRRAAADCAVRRARPSTEARSSRTSRPGISTPTLRVRSTPSSRSSSRSIARRPSS